MALLKKNSLDFSKLPNICLVYFGINTIVLFKVYIFFIESMKTLSGVGKRNKFDFSCYNEHLGLRHITEI